MVANLKAITMDFLFSPTSGLINNTKMKTALEFLKENIEETNIPEEHWENEIAELMEWYADYYYQQMKSITKEKNNG